MDLEQKFLDRIRQDRHETLPREIYADWLEEQGDSRSRWLRVQVELSRLDVDDPRHAELSAEATRLMREIKDLEWLILTHRSLLVWYRSGLTEDDVPLFRSLLLPGRREDNHPLLLDDARAIARDVIEATRGNLEIIFERLRSQGYVFAQPDPWQLPEIRDFELLETLGLSLNELPHMLDLWLGQLGRVDLREAAVPESLTGFQHALVFAPELDWLDLRHQTSYHRRFPHPVPQFRWFGLNLQTPLEHYAAESRILYLPDFTTDALLKFSTSWYPAGEPPDGSQTPPGFGFLSSSRSIEIPLVDYLRHCFHWGGFPGLSGVEDEARQEWALRLGEGLQEL